MPFDFKQNHLPQGKGLFSGLVAAPVAGITASTSFLEQPKSLSAFVRGISACLCRQMSPSSVSLCSFQIYPQIFSYLFIFELLPDAARFSLCPRKSNDVLCLKMRRCRAETHGFSGLVGQRGYMDSVVTVVSSPANQFKQKAPQANTGCSTSN